MTNWAAHLQAKLQDNPHIGIIAGVGAWLIKILTDKHVESIESAISITAGMLVALLTLYCWVVKLIRLRKNKDLL